MAPYLDLIKWAPVGLEIISQAGKLFEAFKAKKNATTPDEGINAVKEIHKRSDRLAEIGHGFLPDDLKDKAEVPEVVKFKDDVIAVIIAVKTAIESFLELLK